MHNYIQTLAILFLLSCQSSTSTPTQIKKHHDRVAIAVSTKERDEQKDTTGFLPNCRNWSGGVSEGYLQSVDASKDSWEISVFMNAMTATKLLKLYSFIKQNRGVIRTIVSGMILRVVVIINTQTLIVLHLFIR
jgi:hypothetical protein